MRFFQLLGTSFDGAGEAESAPDLLLDGWYYQFGDASAKLPIADQGWNAWNGVLDVESDSATISILHVVAAGLAVATWDTTLSWKGSITPSYLDGDETAMSPLAPDPNTYGSHPFSRSSGVVDDTFTGAASQPAHIGVFTESDTSGGMILLEGSVIA